MKKLISLLLALVMVLGLLAGCGKGSGGGVKGAVDYTKLAYYDAEHAERYGGDLVFAMGTSDAHMDINAAGATSGTSYWGRYIYESALATGIDGKLYPLVCEYKYDEENNNWLELWVREGVTFHDGTAVTIEDVWASYNRNPKYQHIHEGITKAEIKDGVLHIDYDPAVGCVKALYWFGYYDVSFGIMPKRICDQFSGIEEGVITDPQYVIGTGPYKLIAEECIPQEIYPMTRHEGYIPCFDGNVLDIPNGRAAPRIAYLDTITLVVNTDNNTSMMNLLKGEYDIIYSETNVYKATLEPKGYQMYSDVSGKPISDTPALFFNLHSKETATGDSKASSSVLANDENLRKAICAAINIDEAMYSTYSDWWTECYSPVICEGYDNSAFENAPYRTKKGDIELAKQFLAKSNYKGQELVLRRPSNAGHAICQVIQKNCKAAGINVVLDPVDISAYQADYRCGASGWDMYLLFGANTSAWPGFMPVNSYIPWGDKDAAAIRARLFSEVGGTEESQQAWKELSQKMADDCTYYVLGKSKGDRFVQAPGLNCNYTGYSCYYSSYWDNPSEHVRVK